jgi:hypothetical protein
MYTPGERELLGIRALRIYAVRTEVIANLAGARAGHSE